MTETYPGPATPDSESNASPVERRLARRITGWTNNLLVTAVVVMVTLVVGRQLVGMWVGERESGLSTSEMALTDQWPSLTSAQLEFGEGPFRLIREELPPSQQAAADFLRQRCCQLMVTAAAPESPPGEAESRLLQRVQGWKPVNQESGKWRLFEQVDNPDAIGSRMPVLLGIRDDCPGEFPSRLVVFGLTLPNASETNTAFLFQTRPVSSTGQLVIPIPDGCRRTLAIGGDEQGKLIGFQGGTVAESRAFYDRWADKSNWQAAGMWEKTGLSWNRRFMPLDSTSKITGIEANLTVDDAGVARGLLVVGGVDANSY